MLLACCALLLQISLSTSLRKRFEPLSILETSALKFAEARGACNRPNEERGCPVDSVSRARSVNSGRSSSSATPVNFICPVWTLGIDPVSDESRLASPVFSHRLGGSRVFGGVGHQMAQKRKQRDLPAEAAELPEQKKRKKPRKSNQEELRLKKKILVFFLKSSI